jgi:hypothetical protein
VELVLDRDVSNNEQKPCYVNPNVGMNIYKLNKISFQISIIKGHTNEGILAECTLHFYFEEVLAHTEKSHFTFG